MKLLKKYIAIALLAAMLTTLGLHFFSRLLTPKGELEKFYDEPRNTIDLLIVGSSHSMAGISPLQLYEETGLTAYNLSTWSQPIWVSYHYILEALKYQQPKVVVLDVFGAFYDRSYLTGVDIDLVSDDYASLMRPSLNLLRLNLARRQSQLTAKTWDEYLNITKYHSRLNRLEWEDLAVMFRNDRSVGKGYGPMYTTESFSGFVSASTDRREPLYGPAAEYLERIIALSEEKGFHLILTKVPYITTETDIALLNEIQALSDAKGIPFVDLCRQNIAALDYACDLADHGHLNYRGAEKATAVLSEHINALQLDARHPQQLTQHWQEAAAIESDNFRKMDIRLTPELEAKLAKAAAREGSVVIALYQGELSAAEAQRLAALGAETPLAGFLATAQHGSYLICDATPLPEEAAAQWLAEHDMQLLNHPDGSISLQYRGEEYSHRLTGLNLLLFDTAAQEIYQEVSYGVESDLTAFTG